MPLSKPTTKSPKKGSNTDILSADPPIAIAAIIKGIKKQHLVELNHRDLRRLIYDSIEKKGLSYVNCRLARFPQRCVELIKWIDENQPKETQTKTKIIKPEVKVKHETVILHAFPKQKLYIATALGIGLLVGMLVGLLV